MPNLDPIKLRVTSDYEGKGVEEAESKIASFSKNVVNASKAFTVGVGAAGAAAIGFGAKAIQMAADMETTEIAFKGILGSSEKATAMLQDLNKFAASTPFDFPGLAMASKNLLAVGFAAKDVIPTMTKIGNVAATLGVSSDGINSVVRALGQMKGKGKVSAEELNQVSEAMPGFSAVGAIAKGVGLSTQDAFKAIEKGAIPVDVALQAMLKGMEEFPGAVGAMDRQSQTVNGLFSTLKDTIGMTMVDIGKKLTDALDLRAKMGTAISALGTFKDVLSNQIIPALAEFVSHKENLLAVGAAFGVMMLPALIAVAVAVAPLVLGFIALSAQAVLVGAAVRVVAGHWAELKGWFDQNATAIEVVASVIGFALLPQMIALGVQLGLRIVQWGIYAVTSMANAAAQTYMFVTSGWQSVAVLAAQGVQIAFAILKWAALNTVAGIQFLLTGQLTAAFIAQKIAMLAGAVATGVITAAQWAWNIAMSANPIGLIIIGIAALAAGLIYAAGKWDVIKEAALKAMQPVIDIIKKVGDALGKIPGVGAVTGMLKNINIPGFAEGVSNFRGGMAVVGERGPELVNLPRGSDVIPNKNIQGMSGSNVNVYQTNYINNDLDAQAIGRSIGFQIARS